MEPGYKKQVCLQASFYVHHITMMYDWIGFVLILYHFNTAINEINSRNLLRAPFSMHISNRMIEDKQVYYLDQKPTTHIRYPIPRPQHYALYTHTSFILLFLAYKNEILDMHQSQSCSRAYHTKSKNTAVFSLPEESPTYTFHVS